jgi:methyl-accepting chemotaxis protein
MGSRLGGQGPGGALHGESIRQASTQNVAGTKQAEIAAHNLHELGEKLKQLAEQYRV